MANKYSELAVRSAMEGSPDRANITDHATAVAGPATITKAALPNQRHVISGVTWSFSGVPAAAYLQITFGGVVTYYIPITHSGPGILRVKRRGAVNSAMVITLGNTAAAIRGDVNIDHYWTEP